MLNKNNDFHCQNHTVVYYAPKIETNLFDDQPLVDIKVFGAMSNGNPKVQT